MCVQELRSVLIKKVSLGPADVIHKLQSHLSVKERLLQEVMSQNSRQQQQHHRQITELLDTISSRDQQTQVPAPRNWSFNIEQTKSQLDVVEIKMNDIIS